MTNSRPWSRLQHRDSLVTCWLFSQPSGLTTSLVALAPLISHVLLLQRTRKAISTTLLFIAFNTYVDYGAIVNLEERRPRLQ